MSIKIYVQFLRHAGLDPASSDPASAGSEDSFSPTTWPDWSAGAYVASLVWIKSGMTAFSKPLSPHSASSVFSQCDGPPFGSIRSETARIDVMV